MHIRNIQKNDKKMHRAGGGNNPAHLLLAKCPFYSRHEPVCSSDIYIEQLLEEEQAMYFLLTFAVVAAEQQIFINLFQHSQSSLFYEKSYPGKLTNRMTCHDTIEINQHISTRKRKKVRSASVGHYCSHKGRDAKGRSIN